jgi:hypothetical protein
VLDNLSAHRALKSQNGWPIRAGARWHLHFTPMLGGMTDGRGIWALAIDPTDLDGSTPPKCVNSLLVACPQQPSMAAFQF